MGYLDNFKSAFFWSNVAKLAIFFFVVFILISLLISHFSDVFAGNWEAIAEAEWTDGKWKSYFLIRIAISIAYAVYMVSRKSRNYNQG
ncbi:MAG TPA: hypothetical protein VFM70_00450 [Salinimicrobium sp.]|nr:hypothetical protein [Salinimicrobium sp.]